MKAASFALLFTATAASSQATVLTFNPVADATLYESPTGGLANSAGTRIFAGRTNQGSNNLRRTLIEFDLSSIPTDAVINSVSLAFQRVQGGGGDNGFDLHRVTTLWGEGPTAAGGGQGGGATATAADPTWTSTGLGTTWTNVGGDFVGTASATATGSSTLTLSGAGLVADVTSFLDDESQNFGWILIGDETAAGSAAAFNSREAGTQPVLTVDFTAVPEPSSALLGLVGGLALLRRRR